MGGYAGVMNSGRLSEVGWRLEERRGAFWLVGLVGLLATGVVARMVVGGVGGERWAWPESETILELRGLRAATAVVVGAALAVAGVLLQALMRNPLAAPDLLGVSSGASLAVVIASAAGVGTGFGGGMVWQAGPALIGAVAALALVYGLGQRRGVIDPVGLVLIGVIVGVLCGAGVLLVQHLRPDGTLGSARALIGAFSDETPWGMVVGVGLLVGLALGGVSVMGTTLDAASLGDDEAASVGVPVERLRLVLFGMAGVLVAGAVVLAGPVGFVGLIAPHLARLTVGARHRVMMPAAALIGAATLVWADVAVKAINLGAGRMPIGIVTAVIGGPVLLWMLRGRGGQG